MNRPLFAILIAAILMTSVASQDSLGENTACSRDCEAPTLGQLDDGKKIIENGLAINDKFFDVKEYAQMIPTMTFAVGQPLKMKMLVYENNGVRSLQHVSFTISDYKDERHQNDKVSVSFDQDFAGMQKTNIVDFDKLLDDVKIDVASIDSFTTSVVFTFKFQKPIDTSSIIIDVWDNGKNSRKNIFLDAIKVEDRSLEKIIEKKMAEKKTAQKKDQKNDKIEKEKSSENSKEKSKFTKKPQVAKGKKKTKLPQQYEY